MTTFGKMTIVAVAGALAFATSGPVSAAQTRNVDGQAEPDRPRPTAFWEQDETGRWVKLMPTPDRALEQWMADADAGVAGDLLVERGVPDGGPAGLPGPVSFAQGVNGFAGAKQVYPGSYGSGNLIDHGGPELSNAKTKAMYYNASAANAVPKSGTTLQAYVSGFLGAFGGGIADYSIIQQYGSSNPIAAGFSVLADYVGTNSTPSRISDSGVQSWLTARFNGGIAADASTLYLVFLPPGTRSTMGGSSSCTGYCGYHSHYTYSGKQIKYAVLPYLSCSGCLLSGLTTADSMSIVTAHEIREAVTDPGDSNVDAWYDSTGYEADDKCAWHNLYRLNPAGYYVQPEYSNADSGCVAYP